MTKKRSTLPPSSLSALSLLLACFLAVDKGISPATVVSLASWPSLGRPPSSLSALSLSFACFLAVDKGISPATAVSLLLLCLLLVGRALVCGFLLVFVLDHWEYN